MKWKRAHWDGLDMWWGWEKRRYLRKCYEQKQSKNDQEEDLESVDRPNERGCRSEREET